MEETTESPLVATHFVPRRRPASQDTQPRTSRPHSIGATIISNPKLVKGWQYYDNNADERNVRRYFSTINLGRDEDQEEASFLDTSPVQEEPEEEVGTEVQPVVLAKERPFVQRLSPTLGILLALLSCTIFAGAKAHEEILFGRYHPYVVLAWTSQLLFWISFVILLCPCQMRSISLTRPLSPPTWTNSKGFTVFAIFLRGLFSWIIPLLYIWSNVPTSTVLLLSSVDPVIVFPLAWICLREKPGFAPVFIGALVIAAVVHINLPVSFTNFTDLSYCVLAVLLESGCLVINRHLRHVHWAMLTFVQGLIGSCGAAYLYYFQAKLWTLPHSTDTYTALILIVLIFLANIGILGAVKFEQAGIVSVVACWGVPMTIMWQVLCSGVWNWDFAWHRIVPFVIILFGISALIIRKIAATGRRSRKWFRLLLI